MGLSLVRNGALGFAIGTNIANIIQHGLSYCNIVTIGCVLLGIIGWWVTLEIKNKEINEIKRGN
jgi:hypothetical protein